MPGSERKWEGAPWEKEASSPSTHFPEFGWGESRHLGTPRRDQSHPLDLNKLAFPQLAAVLAAPGLQSYFLQCVAPMAAPLLTPFSVWALRHEYHLQYLALTLAQRAVGTLQPPTLLSAPSAPHYLHFSSMEPVLFLAGNAISTFFQTRPSAYILFAYVLILTSVCFVPSQPLNPPLSVHRQHSSQCRSPMLPSIMAWPWPC